MAFNIIKVYAAENTRIPCPVIILRWHVKDINILRAPDSPVNA